MMTGRKRGPWECAFHRIRSVYRPQGIHVPKPTSADLDAAEDELNFRFPDSYRAFAEQFGLGGNLDVMVRLLPLTRPTWVKEPKWSDSVVDATRYFHTEDWRGVGSGDVAPLSLLQRVVVFAIDPSYHEWAFDPLELTDPLLRECRIYDFGRMNNATAVAGSFGEWLCGFDDSTE